MPHIPNTKSLLKALSTLGLLSITDFGDHLESRQSIVNCRPLHAILDNVIHCWVGVLTWSVLNEPEPWALTQDFIAVAFGSSFIDVDHFIAARSWSISRAQNAGHRGIFHCSGLAIVIALILQRYQPQWTPTFLAAVIPHHLRDAQRRGIYLVPFNHHFDSRPINKYFVTFLLPSFPWALCYFQSYFTPVNTISPPMRIYNV